jgi:RNA polymerase sigma factor (sigma-70 family)
MAKADVNSDPAGSTDGELIARSLRASELFAEIFDRHHAAVHAYAARRAGVDAADDVLADVFLTAFTLRTRFKPSAESALPWLYGIAGNILKRRWRSLATTDRLHRSVAHHTVAASDSHEDGVADRLDSAADWVVVRDVLDELADGDREAILLFAWEELSYPEIAVAMDIPVGTVRSRIHRARARLREALGDILEVGR